jgi:hypothetical protein
MGAMGVLTKPVRTREALDETFARVERFLSRASSRVLLVDGSDAHRASSRSCRRRRVDVTAVGTAADALAAVRAAEGAARSTWSSPGWSCPTSAAST